MTPRQAIEIAIERADEFGMDDEETDEYVSALNKALEIVGKVDDAWGDGE